MQKIDAEERSKDLILMRLEAWNVPENLKPVDSFDEPKQNTAFGRSAYMNNVKPQGLDSSIQPEL